MRSSKQQPPPEASIEIAKIAKIAKEAGFAITAEDIQSTQSETVELSEEQLERANGGNLTGSLQCYLDGSTEGRQVSPME